MVKIGILSFAHMHAYSYAESLKMQKNARLVAIYDDVVERGMKAAEAYHVPFVHELEEFLNLDLDAVIITSENAKHKEHVIQAAYAGKHILCEKPIAIRLQDAEEMIRVCDEKNIHLGIAFPVRFSPAVKRVRRMIHKGKIGRILAMRSTNRGRNPGGWFIEPELSGGGAVMDHTVHMIDLMRWFTGSEVSEVYAEIGSFFSDNKIDDSGLLILEFQNGIIASHDPSWSRCKTYPTWGDITMEIVGTDGVIMMDALAQNFMIYSDRENRVLEEYWGDSYDDGLINDFVSAVQEGRKPLVTGMDGLKALEVALAAYESAKLKRPVLLT
ncbi:putative dehydrogenase [[Clostridium] ultunense Esp]|nr:putative dehydrogenase [[Clostridium] ultunense Esp]